jgi:hypothetical protein
MSFISTTFFKQLWRGRGHTDVMQLQAHTSLQIMENRVKFSECETNHI